jgi:hypothetical protein
MKIENGGKYEKVNISKNCQIISTLALNIVAFSIMTFRIMTLSIKTFSTMTFSITINKR